MSRQYDLIVIGSGAAGLTAASICRAAGWSVAVADARPLGGTCALRGCDPKRVLMSAAEATDAVRRLKGHGVAGDARISWPELMAFKRGFTDPVPAEREDRMAREGIDVLRGTVRFTAPDTLEVNGRSYRATHVLIAAGARPAPLKIEGEEHLALSEDFLALEALPERIALIGGGYIAAEFSHLAVRAGAQVTILQRGERLLPRFDPDLVAIMGEHMRALGIRIETNASVKKIERTGSAFAVTASQGGTNVRVEADLVVHAAGRVPDLADLDLAAGNVAVESGRPVLNEFLQSTTNSAVYAAGDAASVGPALTPIASRDGRIAADNMLTGNRHPLPRGPVASVVFTIPPLASIGMSEKEVPSSGTTVHFAKSGGWYTARRVAETASAHKVLIDAKTDRILGAHLIGPSADETINLFALAMHAGITADKLKDTILAYPTAGSDLKHMLA